MQEHCLITGSSGFIGSALSAALSQKGYKVHKLDRKLLYNRNKLEEVVTDIKPNYIFHLASYGNKYDQTDDNMIFEANVTALRNMLYASQNVSYKAFINFGSSSEYGLKHKPMKETDSLQSETFYGATKAMGSLLCRAFAVRYHKPVVTARPFSVYGPKDDPAKFIPTAIRCFKNMEELTLAPGVHDWINIEDFIEGVMVVMKNANQLQGQAVNIGTGFQSSNQQVISMLRVILSVPGKIKYVDNLRSYDTTKYWVADNSLLCSLGWKPKHSLEADLEEMSYGH